jgi:hypothetical protein
MVVSPGLSGVEVVVAFLLVVGPGLTGVEAAAAILLVVGPGLTGDGVAKEVEVDVDAFLEFFRNITGLRPIICFPLTIK